MIVRCQEIDEYAEYCGACSLINSAMGPDDFIFFDIETTGLSANSSALYIIGILTSEKGKLSLTQYFAEAPEDEQLLIQSFSEALTSKKVLVHFNGSTFDIPYLENKGFVLSNILSFDLYKELKSLRPFLKAVSMNLKSLERISGLFRKDKYDGEELIELYLRWLATSKIEYLKKQNSQNTSCLGNSYLDINKESGLEYLGEVIKDNLLDTLLLHNFEDLTGLIKISQLLHLLPDRIYESVRFRIIPTEIDDEIEALFDLPSVFGLPTVSNSLKDKIKDFFSDNIKISINENEIRFKLYLTNTELKLFFDNYKDYYYLPEEDTVIPREIAGFIDSSHKEKATPENCCTKAYGHFIPILKRNDIDIKKKNINPSIDGIHTFREKYNSVSLFVDEKEFLKADNKQIIDMFITPLLK